MNVNEKARRAKQWGQTHGYFGLHGGWIYKNNNQIKMRGPRHGVLSRTGYKPVCQGWNKLYDKKAAIIEKWFTDRDSANGG